MSTDRDITAIPTKHITIQIRPATIKTMPVNRITVSIRMGRSRWTTAVGSLRNHAFGRHEPAAFPHLDGEGETAATRPWTLRGVIDILGNASC